MINAFRVVTFSNWSSESKALKNDNECQKHLVELGSNPLLTENNSTTAHSSTMGWMGRESQMFFKRLSSRVYTGDFLDDFLCDKNH